MSRRYLKDAIREAGSRSHDRQLRFERLEPRSLLSHNSIIDFTNHGGAIEQILLATGFEQVEGFSPGFLANQGGWSTFTHNQNRPIIATENSESGLQHLGLRWDPTLPKFGSQGATGAFSPVLQPQQAGRFIVSFDLFLNAAGDHSRCFSEQRTDCGGTLDVVPQSQSEQKIATFLTFDSSPAGVNSPEEIRRIFVRGVDTGTQWHSQSYDNVTIDVDALNNRIDFYYGGSHFYTSAADAARTIDQLVFRRFNLDERLYYDVDNVVIARVRQFDNDRFEANDSATVAHNFGILINPLVESGIIAGPQDWFKFETQHEGHAGDEITVSFLHEVADVDLFLYSEQNPNSPIRESRGTTNSERISLNGLPAGRYYLQVTNFGSRFLPNYSLSITPPQARTVPTSFEVEIVTFIPGNHIPAPFFHPASYCDGTNLLYFAGDNRGFNPNAISFRTKQSVTIIPDASLDSDGLLEGSKENLVGITESFAADALLDGQIDESDRDELGDCHLRHEMASAETSGMLIDDPARIDSRTVSIRMRTIGGPSNPLLPLPPGIAGIDWDFLITIDVSGAAPRFEISGNWDGFPAIEIYINGQEIFTDTPGNGPYGLGDILKLLPGFGNIAVHESGDLVSAVATSLIANGALSFPGAFGETMLAQQSMYPLKSIRNGSLDSVVTQQPDSNHSAFRFLGVPSETSLVQCGCTTRQQSVQPARSSHSPELRDVGFVESVVTQRVNSNHGALSFLGGSETTLPHQSRYALKASHGQWTKSIILQPIGSNEVDLLNMCPLTRSVSYTPLKELLCEPRPEDVIFDQLGQFQLEELCHAEEVLSAHVLSRLS